MSSPVSMRLANIRNGLAFPHDDVCYFQSQWGHQHRLGYFRIDSMPYSAVIHLLEGGRITIVDGTRRHKPLTDALRFGVPTWCLVFNRAIYQRHTRVCEWQTPLMQSIANSDIHKPCVQTIRKLARLYRNNGPAIIGENVILECHQAFAADDNVRRLARYILRQPFTGGLLTPPHHPNRESDETR